MDNRQYCAYGSQDLAKPVDCTDIDVTLTLSFMADYFKHICKTSGPVTLRIQSL